MDQPEIGTPGLSVVVPCYNEAGSLQALHERVSAVLNSVVGASYEIILVNDGSRDDTWVLMQDLSAKDPRIVAVNLSRNYGHQIALTAGLELARGNRILVIDADLQDPPELLPQMMTLMDEGHDVVFGQRIHRSGETRFKLASAKLFYRLLDKLVDVPIPMDAGDFRLMSRRVLNHLLAMPERYRFIRGMVSWIGFSQVPIHYARDERFAGETNYSLGKMISLAADAMTSFSIIPLRIASHLGFAFGLGGLFMLGFVLMSYLNGGTVHGWTSLTALILILGSLQLLMLGVFGEYVGRMYMESKERPLFIVDRIVRTKASELGSPVLDLQHKIKFRINEK